MILAYLRLRYTIKGNVVLTFRDKQGNVIVEDRFEGTEDLCLENGFGLWDWLDVKYIYAGQDGYLHIDCEVK